MSLGGLLFFGYAKIRNGKIALSVIQCFYLFCILASRFGPSYTGPEWWSVEANYEAVKANTEAYFPQFCKEEVDASNNSTPGPPTDSMGKTHLQSCIEDQVTYRIGYAVATNFVILLVLALCGFGVRVLTNGMFINCIFPAIFAYVYMYVPDRVFDGYLSYTGIVTAPLFLTYLFTLVLAFAAKWNDSWNGRAAKADDERKARQWNGALLGFSFVFLAASCAIFGVLVHLGGTRRLVLACCTFGLMGIFTLISILSVVRHGSLLVSAIISAYLMTLCWGSQFRSSYDTLNVVHGFDLELWKSHTAYLFIMMCWFIPALVISSREQKEVGWNSPENEIPIEAKAQTSIGINNLEEEVVVSVVSPDTKPERRVRYFWTANYFLFHVCSALAVTHLATTIKGPFSHTLFGVNLVAISICLILYLAYLIVPTISRKHVLRFSDTY